MTTIKSSSEKSRFVSILRSALKNQLAFAIIVTIILALVIPVVFFVGIPGADRLGLTDTAQIKAYYAGMDYFASGVYLEHVQSGIVLCILMLFSMVIALVQNAYLHSKKMTDLYHSLPVRRPQLLGANMLSSLTTILLPFFAVTLVTMVLQLALYGKYIPDMGKYLAFIGLDLVWAVIVVTAVYVFTTFIAVNVGTVFDAFALSCVVGATPMIVVAICGLLWTSMMYGVDVGFDWIMVICPFLFGFQRYVWWYAGATGAEYREQFTSVAVLGAVWILVCGVLFWGACMCYNRRRSEDAEQTQTGGVLQTIAKCAGAFSGAALFFAIFYQFGSVVVWLLVMVAGAVLIGLIAELILSRGVRGVKKNLKWLVGAGLLCFLVLLVSRFDFLGVCARVPDADSVEMVMINYRGRFSNLSGRDIMQEGVYLNGYYGAQSYTDPETIAVVTEAHRLAVSDRPPLEYEIEDDETYDRYPYNWTMISYVLKNGSTISRYYGRINLDAIEKLAELEGTEGFIRNNHMIFYGNDNTDAYNDVRDISVYDALGGDSMPYKLGAADTKKLLDAVRADMLSESLEQIMRPGGMVRGYLEIRYNNSYSSDNTLSTCTVPVAAHYTATLAVLEELGMDEMLGMPEEEPDRMFLTWIGREYGFDYQVYANVPGNGDHFYQNWLHYPDQHTVVEDAGEIKNALDNSVGQRMILRNGEDGRVLMAAYYKDDVYLGSSLVDWNDLSQETRQALADRYYGEYREFVFAEEVNFYDEEGGVEIFLDEVTAEEAA